MIELSFQYRPLIKVSVYHEYFDQKLPKNLSFELTANAKKKAQQLGLLFRTQANGFELLVDHTQADALKMRLASEESIQFSCWVNCNNPYFSHITDSASLDLNHIFYFENSQKDKLGKEASLHNGEEATEADHRLLSPSVINLANKKKIKQLMVYNQEGSTVHEQVEIEPEAQYKAGALAEGIYSIYGDGLFIQKFIVLPFKRPRYPVAMVNIALTEQIRKHIIDSIESGEKIPSYPFSIHFKARATYWRYTLVSRYTKGLEKAAISASDKKTNFKGPEEVQLPNGATAQMFSSKELLQLHEFAQYNFQLAKKNGQKSAEKVLVNRLPAPSIDSLRTEQVKPNQHNYFSDIIVYI